MFLATTSLDDFWDKNSPILFLGDWCTLASESHKWKDLDHQYLPILPLDNDYEAQRVWQVYIKTLPVLSDFLNQYHSTQHSDKYYEDILGRWLMTYLEKWRFYYLQIKEAFKSHQDLQTILLDESCFYIPTNLWNAYRKWNEPIYSLQLCSQIIKKLGYEFPEKKSTKAIPQQTPYQAMPRHKLSPVLTKLSKLVAYGSKKKMTICVMYYDTTSQLLSLWSKMSRNVIFDNFDYIIDLKFNIDKKSRKTTLHIGDTEFERILGELLLQNLPLLYLEGFQDFHQKVMELPITKTPVIFSASALFFHDIYGFYLAENPDIKRLYMQHGGNYSIIKNLNGRKIEQNHSDMYYNWGWENSEKCKYMAHPKLAYNQNDKKENILFIQTTAILHTPEAQDFYRSYVQDTITFFQKLSPDESLKILFRMHYAKEINWSPSIMIQEKYHCENIIFDDFSKPFYTRIREAKICIFDHMMTTWLQTMSSNIPTLVFINPDKYDFTHKAQQVIENLVKQKIVHYSPESAAEHLNEIHENIDEWWNKSDVQKAKEEFVYNFARGDKNWATLWAKEFKRVLDETK